APTTVAAAATPAAAPAPTAAAGAGGEALYKQACFACHAAGVAGAPKFGDKAAWAPRIQQGMPVLVQSVTKGKGAMPPKGGSSASDAEIQAAVAYMVNAAK
uniref:c-type cytochrome n=1 Tax=Ramlibacter sp. TaxID=1917967 RepID=UPI001809BDB2